MGLLGFFFCDYFCAYIVGLCVYGGAGVGCVWCMCGGVCLCMYLCVCVVSMCVCGVCVCVVFVYDVSYH